MELNLERQPAWMLETAAETAAEQALECDALLPDSCPDLSRVLRCGVRTWAGNRSVSGSQLEVEGVAEVTVFYLCGEGELHRAEYKLPFSRTMELKKEIRNPAVTVSCRAGYFNCRVVNPRRLDLRGAVNLSARVMGCREEQLITAGDGGGLQLRQERQTAARLLGEALREIEVDEVQELSYGKPEPEEILSCRGTPRLLECKVSGEQAVVRGELEVQVFFRAEGGYSQTSMTFPLAAVAELPGLDERSQCDVRLYLQNCSAELEEGGIHLEAEVLAQIRAYSEVENLFCSDCYSTRYPCTAKLRSLSGMKLSGFARETFSARDTVQLAEPADEILDFWCEPAGLHLRADGEGMSAEGKAFAAMFVRMSSGEIHYFEKNLDLKTMVQGCEEDSQGDLQMMLSGCTGNLTARDTVEVRCEAVLEGPVFLPVVMQAVEEITIDDKKPRTDTAPAGLYLCLTASGESLWDIARRYDTSVEKILEENPEGGEEGVLLIPVCG